MKRVTRINLIDHVLLTRLELARQKIGDGNVTRTTHRLLDAQLDALGIEKLPQATPPAANGGPAVQKGVRRAR